MGCWDIFCFLCGNNCHGIRNEPEEFLEYISENKQVQKDYIIKFNKMIKNTKWLTKCTFLCANNMVIHGCKETGCNIQFYDKKTKKYYYHNGYYVENGLYGLFVHTDCWKFIKKEYNIKLNFSYLPILNFKNYNNKLFKFINYGTIEKYWGQDFNFNQIILDNNQEICISPLKSDLVANNIKKIFSKLKIRSDDTRISPVVSATFYTSNTYKVGTNRNIWCKKGNKWVEIKDTIKIIVPNLKAKNIVLMGDVNKEPIFIINIITNKKNTEYEILSSNEYVLVNYPNLVI